jgi:Flp pilus assembly pilin Flp
MRTESMGAGLCRRAGAFLRAEAGAAAVEYAVLAALLVCACLASLLALGPAASATFSSSTSVVGTYGVP